MGHSASGAATLPLSTMPSSTTRPHARARARLIALSLALVASGCAAGAGSAVDEDAISGIPTTEALNQGSSGNCWLYSGNAFVESISGKTDGHYSVAYLSYWDFYERILENPDATKMKWRGGNWDRYRRLVSNYGLMSSQSFVPDDMTFTVRAFLRLNATLTTGALNTASARRDPARVRLALNAAFGLPAPMARALDLLFGPDAAVNLDMGARAEAPILDPRSLEVVVPTADQGMSKRQLQDVLGSLNLAGRRSGKYMWETVSFPGSGDVPPSAQEVRAYYTRVQRVLNTGTPVQLSWFVDPSRQNAQKQFVGTTVGPVAKIGSHAVLITDYQIDDVPKFGTLVAGQLADEAQKEASLDPGAKLVFLRVKNSWGDQKGNPIGGYNDLYADYLSTPLNFCSADDPGAAGCGKFPSMLRSAVLPPGF